MHNCTEILLENDHTSVYIDISLIEYNLVYMVPDAPATNNESFFKIDSILSLFSFYENFNNT